MSAAGRTPHPASLLPRLAAAVVLTLVPALLHGQADSLHRAPPAGLPPPEGRAVNLGPAVNTQYSELMPMITADGRTLYFVRLGHPQNAGIGKKKTDQDIWASQLGADGTWSQAQHIALTLNNANANAVCGLSADGLRAVVLGFYRDGKYLGRGFSLTQRTGNEWSPPRGMIISGYDMLNQGRSITAALTSSGNAMLIAFSGRKDDRDHNMYVTFRLDDTLWTYPKPLKPLNSDYEEACPFLAADGETLYFASDRPGGYGDYDMYITRRLDDTWDNWTPPMNMGPVINSPDGDAYHTVPASGAYAYFVSTRTSGTDSDIMRVVLPDSLRPRPVALVRGKVLDERSGAPLDARITFETLPDGKVFGATRTNPETGDYIIVLPRGHTYGYYAERENYFPASDHLHLDSLRAYSEVQQNLPMTAIEEGATIRLNNIFFDFDKYDLRSESYPELERVVRFMRDYPLAEIEVTGHTDTMGTYEYNVALSKNRAQSVVDYLLLRGASKQRIKAAFYSFTKPIATNETDEGRQLNRRVEFTIRKLK